MPPVVCFAAVYQTLYGLLMFLTAIFLIMLILVQRGRGGGLAGAFGGMGGQSAFGSKAGDTFTFITMIVATFWILMCVAGVWAMKGAGSSSKFDTRRPGPPSAGVPASPDDAEADVATDGDSSADSQDSAGASPGEVDSSADFSDDRKADASPEE